jgi:hypothetical protein
MGPFTRLTLTALAVAAATSARADDGELVSTRTDSAAAPAVSATQAPETNAPAISGEALSTDEQIRRWLAKGGSEPLPQDVAEAVDSGVYDRRPHGELSVTVGTGGMRAYSGSVTMPIGENGWLGLSYAEGHKMPYGHGYGYGGYGGYSSVGAGFGWGVGGGSPYRSPYWR